LGLCKGIEDIGQQVDGILLNSLSLLPRNHQVAPPPTQWVLIRPLSWASLTRRLR